jgi:hypothetical protein
MPYIRGMFGEHVYPVKFENMGKEMALKSVYYNNRISI